MYAQNQNKANILVKYQIPFIDSIVLLLILAIWIAYFSDLAHKNAIQFGYLVNACKSFQLNLFIVKTEIRILANEY